MHICILSVGTRGDVQPYVALGRGLRTAGHRVQLATLDTFEPLVRDAGLEFARFEESPLSFLERVIASDSGLLRRATETRHILSAMMERLLDDASRAIQDADLIVTSNLLIYPGYHLSDQRGIPSVATLLIPCVRTRAFPNPALLSGEHTLGGPGNLLSYDLFNLAVWQLYRGGINRQRQRLGQPRLPVLDVARQMLRERYPFLCAYSSLVAPRPGDWDTNVRVTGYWFLDAPAGWRPPGTLEAFLHTGPPPVYVGFGSMKAAPAEATLELVIRAVVESGHRAVVATGSSGIDPAVLPPGVLALTEAPHDWLFPRMAAVVHHGGAGTTAAGLRAGVPTVTTPVYSDQFFWGRRVAALGAGPPPIPRRQLTAEGLAGAVRRATGDKAVRERAELVGQRLRAEDGVARAVQAIEVIAARPGRGRRSHTRA